MTVFHMLTHFYIAHASVHTHTHIADFSKPIERRYLLQ